jgi:hypothetical protein
MLKIRRTEGENQKARGPGHKVTRKMSTGTKKNGGLHDMRTTAGFQRKEGQRSFSSIDPWGRGGRDVLSTCVVACGPPGTLPGYRVIVSRAVRPVLCL